MFHKRNKEQNTLIKGQSLTSKTYIESCYYGEVNETKNFKKVPMIREINCTSTYEPFSQPKGSSNDCRQIWTY